MCALCACVCIYVCVSVYITHLLNLHASLYKFDTFNRYFFVFRFNLYIIFYDVNIPYKMTLSGIKK